MHILLTWHMVSVEVFKLFCYDNGRVVIGHQMFMSDFVLLVNLVDDDFLITVCFEIFDSNLFSELHLDQGGVVFQEIVGTRLS